MTNSNHFVNFEKKSIIVSKAFIKKAGNIHNKEYQEMKTLRADNPEFDIVIREITKKDNKKTYRNLTYKNMEAVIISREGNPSTVLSDFYKTKKEACVCRSPYSKVKKWFLEQYPDCVIEDEDDNETTNDEQNIVELKGA